jgi:hypothetical protein
MVTSKKLFTAEHAEGAEQALVFFDSRRSRRTRRFKTSIFHDDEATRSTQLQVRSVSHGFC